MLKEPVNNDSRAWRIAAYNARLNANSICPANHNVEYCCGWYYFDGQPERHPDITRRSRELRKSPDVELKFNERWNTYVVTWSGGRGGPRV